MSKFTTGFVRGVIAEEKQDRRHTKIKQKQNLPENAVIVEKTFAAKWAAELVLRIVKFAGVAALAILACVGAIATIYPAPREMIIQIIKEVFAMI